MRKHRVLGGEYVQVFLVFLLIASAGFTVAAVLTKGLTEVLLCLTGAATIAVLLATSHYRRDYDLFEPLSFVILAAIIGTGLKAPYLAFTDSAYVRNFIMMGQSIEVLVPASIMMLIGITALCAGYLVRTPAFDLTRFRVLRHEHWDIRPLTVILAVAVGGSLAAFVLWYRQMGIEITTLVSIAQKRFYYIEGAAYEYSSLGYLAWGISLAAVAFYVLLTWKLKASRPMPLLARIALPLTGLISLAFPIMRSSRSTAMGIILVAMVIVHYLSGGIKLRSVVISAAFGFALFTVLTGARGASSISAVSSAFSVEEVLDVTVGGRHFMDVSKTAFIMDAIPEKVEPKYGETFFYWVIAPIPRSMWKGKPALASGPMLGPTVFGTRLAGVPPGFVAELYMNFGAIGVPFGMFIVGVVLRAIYINFMALRGNVNAVLLYSALILPATFALMQGEFSRVIINILKAIIPLCALFLVVGRARRDASTI